MTDTDDVLDANSKFYKTFAAGDLIAMQYIWAKQHNVAVIHPGWPAIHGYEKVMKSWQSIFHAQGKIDIKCIDAKVYIMPDSAFVICTELLGDTKLEATNFYVKEDDVWKIIHHQATPVQNDDDEETPDIVVH